MDCRRRRGKPQELIRRGGSFNLERERRLASNDGMMNGMMNIVMDGMMNVMMNVTVDIMMSEACLLCLEHIVCGGFYYWGLKS